MSKPITCRSPSAPASAAQATTPPAGPDSTASRPRNRDAGVRSPLDCMICSSEPGSSRISSAT